MRTISTQTLAILNGRIDIDSAFIIAIQWVVGGEKIYYSDRTIPGLEEVLPWIVNMGALDSAKNSDSAGQTNSLTIKLNDITGELKNIFDNNDIHKRLVWVYQYFMGTNTGDKFLLFAGQISTPIVWLEGERTLSFDIVTKLEDLQFGYSAEMGRFNTIALSLIGQPWPMVFGTVQHVPGLALQEIPTAFTTEPFSIPDQSLIAEIAKLTLEIGNFPKYNVAKICGRDLVWTETDCYQEDANDEAFQQGTQLQAQLDALTQQKNQLQETLRQQQIWQRTRIPLSPSMRITQPYTGILKVGNSLFHGHIDNNGGYITTTQPLLEPGNYDLQKQLIKAGYQFINAGTQVTIAGNYPIVYVVSIVPGTVTHVYAYNSFRGLRRLVKVPTEYYTTEVRNYGPGAETTTVVILKQPLSTVNFLYNLKLQNWETNFGQYLQPHIVAQVDWDDSIYVTFESSIGPNPVDIMIYVINHYTTNTYDVANFADVRDKVAVTPMNFLYQALGNAMSFLTELAYQARCAIYLVEDVFHLKFLPESGDAVDSIAESDVELGTLEVTTTSTEDLITTYIATFRPDYSPTYSEPVKAIFRFNVNKYGYHAEEHDFFAFNSFDVVEKVATFWMIRRSMTWKLLKCKLHLNKLNLEIFDTVLLNFARPYVANESVKAMIINNQYSPTDQSIAVEFWVPVRLGEMIPYSPAWKTGIQEIDIFPTYRDIQAGSSGGVSGGTPMDLPPANGMQLTIDLNNRQNFTQGDSSPLGLYDNNLDGLPIVPADGGFLTPPPSTNDPDDLDWQAPEFRDKPKPGKVEWSAVYPGYVEEYKGIDDDGMQIYRVTIYRKGLTGEGVATEAKQLQLDQDDRIPAGAAVLINENAYLRNDQDTGLKSIRWERVIQVGVWLR